ncbi:MAG TPA: hypothetical protein ENN63_01130 [Bacteroidetes bacterium]|mgnify:CR=1 FL=1|nr:hypothetical protein [Bacteroidota bacterium]
MNSDTRRISTGRIRFALAVNRDGRFEKRHFGDASRFLVYEWDGRQWIFLHEKLNIFREEEENPVHNLPEKGRKIMEYLESSGVDVLVSRQFGGNIRLVHRKFIPVIVSHTDPDEVMHVIGKHIQWIHDELTSRPEAYRLFKIKKGILKFPVKK